MFAVSMPNLATPSALVESATKWRAMPSSAPIAASVHRRAAAAFVIVSSVVNVLEAMMNSVSCGSRPWVALAKSAPSTLATKRTVRSRIAERPQRAIGHFRPEIGAADADIDDVADSLAAVSGPGAGPHLARERGHPVEDGVDLGHDILAVDENLLAAFGAQRHMQDGAVLADVDLLAREHRVAPRRDAARPGKLDEQSERSRR